MFPIGWTWSEISPRRNFQAAPWRSKTAEFHQLGQKVPAASTEAAAQASARAAAYRRAKVDRTLRSLIRTSGVVVLVTNERLERRVLSEMSRTSALLRLDLDGGTIDPILEGPEFVFTCEIEARELLDWLAAQSATTGRPTKHDWLLFERISRNLLEAKGLPERQDDYVTQAIVTYAEPGTGEQPSMSSARDHMAALLREYGDSEN